MMEETRREAHEWAAAKGIHLLDPDGWRNEGKTWFEPITEAEFDRLAASSTVGPRRLR